MTSYGEDEYGLYINTFPKGKIVMKRENWGNSFERTKERLFEFQNNKLYEIEYATWDDWEEDKYFCDVKLVDVNLNQFYRGQNICLVKSWSLNDTQLKLKLLNNTQLIFAPEMSGPSITQVVQKLEKSNSPAFITFKSKSFLHPMSPICLQSYFTDLDEIQDSNFLYKFGASPWIFSTEMRSSYNKFTKKMASNLHRRYEIEIPFNWTSTSEIYRNVIYIIMESKSLDTYNRSLTCYAVNVHRNKTTHELHRTDDSVACDNILDKCDHDLVILLNHFQNIYDTEVNKKSGSTFA